MAENVLVDGRVRNQVTAFRNWFDSLRDRNHAAAWSGVVCGGRLAADVLIEGNTIGQVVEAIRVAVSHSAGPNDSPDMAGSVRIRSNDCRHVLPIELSRGSESIFVGNTERLEVSGNHCSVAGVARGETAYDNGVRIYGHLGSKVMVAENVVDHCDTGIYVRARSGTANPHLWAVRHNVAPAASPAVSAPGSTIVTDNVGANP